MTANPSLEVYWLHLFYTQLQESGQGELATLDNFVKFKSYMTEKGYMPAFNANEFKKGVVFTKARAGKIT